MHHAFNIMSKPCRSCENAGKLFSENIYIYIYVLSSWLLHFISIMFICKCNCLQVYVTHFLHKYSLDQKLSAVEAERADKPVKHICESEVVRWQGVAVSLW